jgi:hypothetical protein
VSFQQRQYARKHFLHRNLTISAILENTSCTWGVRQFCLYANISGNRSVFDAHIALNYRGLSMGKSSTRRVGIGYSPGTSHWYNTVQQFTKSRPPRLQMERFSWPTVNSNGDSWLESAAAYVSYAFLCSEHNVGPHPRGHCALDISSTRMLRYCMQQALHYHIMRSR